VAFSDTHLSTPGNPWPPALRDAPYPGGLTGVWATGPTEREVLEAIARGHCFATSGERFLVELTVDGHLPGDVVTAVPRGSLDVRARIAAATGLRSVDLMRGTDVLESVAADGAELVIERRLAVPAEPERWWLRGESVQGERFWTTPIRIVAE